MDDIDIRTSLQATFDAEGIGWVNEVTIRDRRIDMVAMIDGVLTGIEIEAHPATLRRLPVQKRRYTSRFRHLVIATAESQLREVLAGLPPCWGVLVASWTPGGLTLERRKAPARAASDPGKAQPKLLVEMMSVSEIEAALGLAPDAARQKPDLVPLMLKRSVPEIEAAFLTAQQQRKVLKRPQRAIEQS